MKTLIVNAAEVRRLLTMSACIDQMELALQATSNNKAINPLRHVMWLPERHGLLGMMPAALPAQSVMGLKVISVMPGNHGTAYDSHQGAVLLFETGNGRLLAIIDAGEITAIRTAAVSAVATRLLANDDAADLAILGSGIQAAAHLKSMYAIRSLERIRVWSRHPEHAQRFADHQSERGGTQIEAILSVQEAVHHANIICTTTASPNPILLGEWISEGTHINAVGSSTPTTRELDNSAVVNSSLFVDRRESTVIDAGDFLFPQAAGLINPNHIRAELGEVLSGSAKGRSSRQEITLFKSLGLGVEDLVAADYVYQQARQTNTGTWIELNSIRDESA